MARPNYNRASFSNANVIVNVKLTTSIMHITYIKMTKKTINHSGRNMAVVLYKDEAKSKMQN